MKFIPQINQASRYILHQKHKQQESLRNIYNQLEEEMLLRHVPPTTSGQKSRAITNRHNSHHSSNRNHSHQSLSKQHSTQSMTRFMPHPLGTVSCQQTGRKRVRMHTCSGDSPIRTPTSKEKGVLPGVFRKRKDQKNRRAKESTLTEQSSTTSMQFENNSQIEALAISNRLPTPISRTNLHKQPIPSRTPAMSPLQFFKQQE